MFGASIGRAAQRIIDAIVRWLALGHINPNILTVIGVALNVGCGLLFGLGWFFSAGIALIVANLFDMLDGQVARLSGRVTRFGGFLDSSLDRLSDRDRLPRTPTEIHRDGFRFAGPGSRRWTARVLAGRFARCAH